MRMKLKTIYIFFGLFLFNALGFSQNKTIKKKPNVVMILVDDLKPLLGTYGDYIAVSPNIDKLAARGTQFNLAYANQSVCAPSRYNLLLGTRSSSSCIYSFGKDFRNQYPKVTTLPQYIMNAGYHAESMGKVDHIGHGNIGDDASWSVPHHEDKVIEYIVPSSTVRVFTREEAFFNNTRMYEENVPPVKNIQRGSAWEDPYM